MKLSVKKTMSYLGSIKTNKKAKSSRENGKKGGRPLSGISKTCLSCGKDFYIPQWRLNQNVNRGSYCSRECQGNPRIKIDKDYFKVQTSDKRFRTGLWDRAERLEQFLRGLSFLKSHNLVLSFLTDKEVKELEI